MPQLNFNMLATEGPQGVYQGFMQGQQLQNRLAQQEQQRQQAQLPQAQGGRAGFDQVPHGRVAAFRRPSAVVAGSP